LYGTKKEKKNNFLKNNNVKIEGLEEKELEYKLYSYIFHELKYPKLGFNEFQLLTYFLKISSIFCHSLWMIKDNSVRINLGHLKYTDGEYLSVHSNFINSIYSNSIAERGSTKFSKEEINKALEHLITLLNVVLKEDLTAPDNTHAEANRISRAMYFIDQARSYFDIGTKVSLYCSSFECLFSVSNTELKHRLAETIANFLETELSTRRIIYDKVKKIYDLRSSVTHGSGISQKLIKNEALKLKSIGRSCDEIMRRCVNKIFENQELFELYMRNDTIELSEYLINLNFSN